MDGWKNKEARRKQYASGQSILEETGIKATIIEFRQTYRMPCHTNHINNNKTSTTVLSNSERNGCEVTYKIQLFVLNKKYVLSNSESVQCNFFIFDHMTFSRSKSAAVYEIS